MDSDIKKIFLDLNRMVVNVLPVLFDADSDQWELINQGVDELCQTFKSFLLDHQRLSSTVLWSATKANNPIAQIIRRSHIWRPSCAQSWRCTGSLHRAFDAESGKGLQESLITCRTAGDPYDLELSPQSINLCADSDKVPGQTPLERTSSPTTCGYLRSTGDLTVDLSLGNAFGSINAKPRVSPLHRSTNSSSIEYKWEGEVLLLCPSPEEWDEFPALLSYAQGLGAGKVGAFKIQVPKASRYDAPETQTDHTLRKCVKYRLSVLDNGASRVDLVPSKAFFRSPSPSIPDSSSAEQACERFEELLKSSRGLDGVFYRTDVPARDSFERAAAGLPGQCIIWPRQGDQLQRTKYKVPGLHWPYSYESAENFGAVFAYHCEDYYSYSLNQLYVGRKVWEIIPPAYAEKFEKALKTSDQSIVADCAQFVRHASVYVPRCILKQWDIPFTLLDQRAHEIIITLPKAYHAGFSTGHTRAEAVNYAASSWTAEGYRSCTSECSDHPITGDLMQFLSSEEDSEDSEGATSIFFQNDGIDENGITTNTRRLPGRDTSKRKRPLRESASGMIWKKLDVNQATAYDDLELLKSRIPRHMVQPETVSRALSSAKDPELLVRLFYAIASPDAICQLRDACLTSRGEQRTTLLPLSSTVANVVQFLDAEDKSMFASAIRRRYGLMSLVQHRQELLQTIKARNLKGIGLEISAFARDDSQALTELMAEAYPQRRTPARISGASREYQKLRNKMKSRLRQGQNWYTLSERFEPAVLALVPTGEEGQVTTTEIETIPRNDFEALLAFLDEKRGVFLREISASITSGIYDTLQKGKDCSERYAFEFIESGKLKNALLDSPTMIRSCSRQCY